MRRVFESIQTKLSLQKELSKEKVYATVDGVLEPITYNDTDNVGNNFIRNVCMTPIERLNRRLTAKNQKSMIFIDEVVTTTISTPQTKETTTTTVQRVSPDFVFQYFVGIQKFDANNFLEKWISTVGSITLNQTTQANKPTIGIDGRGVVNENAIFFDANNTDKQFMSLNSAVTLSGDFTLFFYICPKKAKNLAYKYLTLLGKSDDNNMFLSIGEAAGEAYKLSFSASNSVAQSITTTYWTPTFDKGLITVIRKSDKLFIREDGVEVFSDNVSTDSFTFDQFGKLGNRTEFGFHGLLYHFSAFQFALDTHLVAIEEKIRKESDRSRDALNYRFSQIDDLEQS